MHVDRDLLFMSACLSVIVHVKEFTGLQPITRYSEVCL